MTTRPYAYNTGSTISGTTQFGNIAVGVNGTYDFSTNPGGVQWYMGPDEELGDIIGIPTITGNSVEFYRTNGRTPSGYTITEQYVLISNNISSRRGYTGFTNTVDAKAYIDSIGFTTFTGVTFEPEALSYFTRMTGGTPSNTLKEIINICIRDLKTTGVWDHIDVLRLANLHTQQSSLLNVKTADFGDGINVNNLSWYIGRGFIGTGIPDGRRIDSNFSPSTQGINYTRNNAFYGAYTAEYEVTFGSNYYTQFINSTNSLCPKSGSGSSYRTRCFTHNTNTVNQNVPPSSLGLTIASRVLSTSCGWYKNGVAGDSDADNSTEIPAGTFGELGGGSASYPAFVRNTVYGGGMSAQNHVDLYNILTTFNNSISSAITYGPELINNGGFDDDNGWTCNVPPGWVISDGVAYHTNEINETGLFSDLLGTVISGKWYKFEFDVSPALPSGGTKNLLIIYGSGTFLFGDIYRSVTDGHNVTIAQATADHTVIQFNGYNLVSNNSKSFNIDNITLKEIIL